MLISYIVESLQNTGDKLKTDKPGASLLVRDLFAAKHVKVSPENLPVAVPSGSGRISFNLGTDNSQYWQAFRTPPSGHSLEFTGAIDPEFLQFFGIEIEPRSVYPVSHWQTADISSVSLGNLEKHLNLSSDPTAAFIEWADGAVNVEIWEKMALRSEIVRDAEVGILTFDDTSEPEDVVLMGRARKIPKDKKSSAIMFHQQPVWRPSNDTATVSLSGGMHPNLELSLDTKSPLETCKLYAYLKLPQGMFIDQFQLEDLPLMTPPSELEDVWGSTDLEAPIWLVNSGSQALISLHEVSNYSIPLHLRYENPGSEQPQRWMPAPEVFWACKDSVKYEPWGIETFYPEGTSFYRLRSNGAHFQIPTIDPAHQQQVQYITAAVVFIGSLVILWSLLKRATLTAGPAERKNR